MKFCLLFNLSPCARYCLLIGSKLTTWSQGNLHYIRLHFFQLDREFFCLLPSLARLYSAAASPSEHLRSDGSLAIMRMHHAFTCCHTLSSIKMFHIHVNKVTYYVSNVYSLRISRNQGCYYQTSNKSHQVYQSFL